MSYHPPDEDAETQQHLNDGLALYAAGRWFEAHEVWEYAWGGEVGRDRLLLQALIQLAAALHKRELQNPRGAAKLLAKAKDKLGEISAASWLGIDLVRLDAELTVALAAADALCRGERAELVAPALPPVASPDGVLYLHGFASSPSSTKARLIAGPLASEGYAVSVPDLNEGDFLHFTVSRALALARRLLSPRTLIIGSSLGGYLATLLAARDERVKSLVLMAPAFGFGERLARRHAAELSRWQREGRVEVLHHGTGRMEPIGYQLLEDARTHPAAPPIRVPCYVLQGRRDDTVPPEVVSAVCADNAGVELTLVDDDHSLLASVELARAAAARALGALSFRRAPAPSDAGLVLRRFD